MSNKDTIYRQAAIEALEREQSLVERPITETRWFDLGLRKAQEVLSKLPSAQPEVLACGEGELSAQPEQTDCDYCHEDSDGFVMPIEKNSHAVIYGSVLHIKAKGWNGKVQIKYCPMCGRRLTDG